MIKQIQERLFSLQDEEYKLFNAKLIPNVSIATIIGIRVPIIRNLAKEIIHEDYVDDFFNELPHQYFEETMLHGLLIGQTKDFNKCIMALDKFLPYVDNWAVCDSMSPKILRKDKSTLLSKIKEWVSSKETYKIRFGVDMLMTHFLDEDFKEEYLEIPSKIKSNEYYVNMMIAWYYATALSKQYSSTIKYIEDHKLSEWIHNKTIQKAIESYRITPIQKEYLRTLKIKSR